MAKNQFVEENEKFLKLIFTLKKCVPDFYFDIFFVTEPYWGLA